MLFNERAEHLQASKRKDQQDPHLLPLWKIQSLDGWHRESQDGKVTHHVGGCIHVPENGQVDARAGYFLIPDAFPGCAFVNRGADACNPAEVDVRLPSFLKSVWIHSISDRTLNFCTKQ